MKTLSHFWTITFVILSFVVTLASCEGHFPVPHITTTAAHAVISQDSVVANWPFVDSVLDGENVCGNPLLDTASYIPSLHKEEASNLIALTFDDGPNTKTTPMVLDVLKKYGAHATFFCIGKNIGEKTRPILKRAVAEGNEIASHTWNHPFLTRISHEKRSEEMRKTADAIYEAVGYYPAYYRPPYLDCNHKVLADISLPAISGSASDDWKPSMAPDMITAMVLETAKPGAIYVMHDFVANTRTPVALETLIPRLQEMGYTLVTVTELFASYGVTPEGHALYTSGTHVAKRADDKTDKSDKSDKSKSDKHKSDKHKSDKSEKSQKHKSDKSDKSDKSEKSRSKSDKHSSKKSSKHSDHS